MCFALMELRPVVRGSGLALRRARTTSVKKSSSATVMAG